MIVPPRPKSTSPSSIASVISWAVVGLLIVWVAIAALAGLITPVFAAAGP